MIVDSQDPKWTAYVMDELGPDERFAVEGLLMRSPEARRLVAEIREATKSLASQFGADSRFRLTQAQLDALDQQALQTQAEALIGVQETSGAWISLERLKRIAAIIVVVGALVAMIVSGILQEEPNDPARAVASVVSEELPPDSAASEAVPVDDIVLEAVIPPYGLVYQPAVIEAEDAPEYSLSREADRNPIAFDDTTSHSPSGPPRSVFSSPFVAVADQPIVRCSLQIGSGNYQEVSEAIGRGELPAAWKIRVEELVNYFAYGYASPDDGQPLAVHLDAATCPWNAQHRLVRIGLKGGPNQAVSEMPLRVFLVVDGVEVRGMDFDQTVLVQAITALRNRLRGQDQLMVIDGSRLGGPVIRIESTAPTAQVLESITRLQVGAGVGIGVSNQWLLTKIIPELDAEGRNEVVMVVGDFESSRTMERLRLLGLLRDAVAARTAGSVLNLRGGNRPSRSTSEAFEESQFLVRSASSVAQANHFWSEILNRAKSTVAKDVRLQLEFNPARVQAYRLVGFDGMKRAPVNEGQVVALGSDIDADQAVTALFEVVPTGAPTASSYADVPSQGWVSNDRPRRTQNMLTVKLSYRLLAENQRVREEYPLMDDGATLGRASDDFKFSASVAAYGMLLSDAPFRGTINHYGVLALAQQGLGEDPHGYRKEFLDLVRRTVKLILKRGGRVMG